MAGSLTTPPHPSPTPPHPSPPCPTQGWMKCDDPTCGFRTRATPVHVRMECRQCKQGHLRTEVSLTGTEEGGEEEASVTMPLLGSTKPLAQCAPASQCVPSAYFNVSFHDCCSVLSIRHFVASFLSSSTLSSCPVHSLYAVQPALLLQGSPQQQREDSHLQRCVCVCVMCVCVV